jgi:GH15 family glucan-1,4-alpha-glucosidase
MISACRRTEFLVCRFWLIDALAALGRREEARERYQDALLLRNSYGLLAEDLHPQTGALWGNFPRPIPWPESF